jgi:hypothetical protein
MITCPVCTQLSTEDLGDLRGCRACGHIFQYPPIVTARYDAQYVGRYDAYPTEGISLLRLAFLEGYVRGGRLLDVGYGNGAFIRVAEAAGFAAFGYDVHGEDYGIAEIDIHADASEWDVVTFFDSLEHFADLQPVRALFERTRFVMVSVPQRPPDFPGDRAWRHYRPGEHLHYFSEASLQRLVARPLLAASNVEDIIRRPAQGRPNILTCLFGGARAT